jgi:hypothetical protein
MKILKKLDILLYVIWLTFSINFPSVCFSATSHEEVLSVPVAQALSKFYVCALTVNEKSWENDDLPRKICGAHVQMKKSEILRLRSCLEAHQDMVINSAGKEEKGIFPIYFVEIQCKEKRVGIMFKNSDAGMIMDSISEIMP